MKKILVVEDEENIANLIKDTLKMGKYIVENVYDGQNAMYKVNNEQFDLIILDIMLPKLNGFEIMEKINKTDIPIIFLSARNDVSTIVKGLSEGGKDYMTKPFEPLELLARVELRIKESSANICTYNDIMLNKEERVVYKNKQKVNLTPKEYDLFLLLIENVGKALSRDNILNKVWSINEEIETRTVDYHIQQLRKKLELKDEIKTINKIGYRIEKLN